MRPPDLSLPTSPLREQTDGFSIAPLRRHSLACSRSGRSYPRKAPHRSSPASIWWNRPEVVSETRDQSCWISTEQSQTTSPKRGGRQEESRASRSTIHTRGSSTSPSRAPRLHDFALPHLSIVACCLRLFDGARAASSPGLGWAILGLGRECEHSRKIMCGFQHLCVRARCLQRRTMWRWPQQHEDIHRSIAHCERWCEGMREAILGSWWPLAI